MKNNFKKLYTALFVCCIAIGFYAMLIEPFSLRIVEHKVTTEKWTNKKSVRIALITDPHMIWPWMTKNHLQKVVDKTNTLNADLIFLLGDYVGDHPFGKQLDPYDSIKPFEDLQTNCGVFAVLGNHDLHRPSDWPDAMRKSIIPVLENNSMKINCNDQDIWISGIEDWWYGEPNIDKTLSEISDNKPIFMLTHNPDAFPWMPKNVTMTFAGHTHAGQIRFPFIGALGFVVPSKYGDKYAHGHYHEDSKDLVVSAGLGMTGLPLRFLNKPEITLITIKAKHEK